jgi:hypothetical protein
MRPKTKVYTLAALDVNGYLAAATGVGPFTTILAQPGDGLAHPVTLASAAALGAITFTINGTDAEGRTISEDLLGPAAGTVTSVALFKTVTSIVNSATLAANTMDAGWTAVGETPIYVVDRFEASGALVVSGVGGAVSYTIMQTNGNVYDGSVPAWSGIGTASVAINQTVSASEGATAVRASVHSHTAGVLTLSHSQASSS